jgi:lipid-binding SYLF domain-containing protein
MMKRRFVLAALTAACMAFGAVFDDRAAAASAAELNAAADATLAQLKQSEPKTVELMGRAKGVLIFPEIVKGGLIIGAAAGEGVLRVGGKVDGYYLSKAVSYGFLAGVTTFGYVMFLMDTESLDYIRDTAGWEVGVGPTVTVADESVISSKLSTSTVQSGIYVFFVNQEGFFAGAGIEGTKITQITK